MAPSNDTDSVRDITELLETSGLADLGPNRRAETLPSARITALLNASYNKSSITTRSQELVRSIVLLWHDHLDESHSISQRIEDTDGSFVHGIMHRREPDYGNSSYWFRRVGSHVCFSEIATRVAPILQPDSSELARRLLPNRTWDPFGFIEACRLVASGSLLEKDGHTLQRVQKIESQVLLEYFLIP